MVDKEELAKDYLKSCEPEKQGNMSTGQIYKPTSLDVLNGVVYGFNQAEELYKQELQTATNLLIRLKNLHYQGDVAQTPLYKDIWEFLKDKEHD